MIKYLIFCLMFFSETCAICTNDCLSVDGARQQVAADCGDTNVCFSPYTVFHEKVFYGMTRHMGVIVSEFGNAKSYGLTKKGWFNTPDILLEGGISRSGNNISTGYDINIIGIKKIFPNDIKYFEIKEKLNYSAIEWGGHNCASIIVEISDKLGYPINCRNYIGNYPIGPNIPGLCYFI